MGFDYNHNWRRLTDFSGQGFYPGINPEDEKGIIGACFCNIHRVVENPLPDWNLEFQVGGNGGYSCPPKSMRMYAYLTYIYGSQAILAWTWRSMLGRGTVSLWPVGPRRGSPAGSFGNSVRSRRKAKLLEQKHLFPRKRQPEIAIAYSFEDLLISKYAKDYYAVSHRDQAVEAFTAAYRLNRDRALVDLRNIENQYRVLILPGNAEITQEMVESIRKQLEGGATVIMTAFSAKVNENNQVFDTSLPGRSCDVFGIKVRAI